MNAQDVFNVALALTPEELAKLFEMLKKRVAVRTLHPKRVKLPLSYDEEIQGYLIKKVFSKKTT